MLLKYLKVIFVCAAGSNLLWTQGQSWPPKHLRIVWPLERLSRSHIWNNTGPMLCREPMRALDFHDVLADTDDATWFDLHDILHVSSACDLWLEKGVSLRQFRSLTRHDKKLPYYDPWLIYQTCGCRHRQNILDHIRQLRNNVYISDVCQCDVKKSLHPGEAAFGSERVRSFRRSRSEERCWRSTKAHHNPIFNHMLKPLRVRNSKDNTFEVLIFELLELCILFWTEHGEGIGEIKAATKFWRNSSQSWNPSIIRAAWFGCFVWWKCLLSISNVILVAGILEVYAIKNCWVWVLKLVGSATHSHIRTHLKGDDILQTHFCNAWSSTHFLTFCVCVKFQSDGFSTKDLMHKIRAWRIPSTSVQFGGIEVNGSRLVECLGTQIRKGGGRWWDVLNHGKKRRLIEIWCDIVCDIWIP